LPIAQALDEAQASLSSLTLFGDPALTTLQSLVNEGLRMRIQLSTIHALMSRRPGAAAAGDGASTPDQGGARILAESPEHHNFSPETVGGGTVRMLLIVDDPDAAIERAVAAGAVVVRPASDEHGWRLGPRLGTPRPPRTPPCRTRPRPVLAAPRAGPRPGCS
jgi:hypothetical protein